MSTWSLVTLPTSSFSLVSLPTDGFSLITISNASRIGELLMESGSGLMQEDGSSAIVLDYLYIWEAA